jgi:hypothetical protein
VGQHTTPTSKEATAEDLNTLEAFKAKVAHAKTLPQNKSGLFPWRSSPELPERLVPGTAQWAAEGLLLGGNLTSSSPRMDGFATACFFLRVPFWDLLLFRNAVEQDLADSMAWAFGQAVQEITTAVSCIEDGNDTQTFSSSPQPSLLRDMMEADKLAKLFESASEFGKESLQVKLETKPILYSDSQHRHPGEEGGNEGNYEITDDLPMGLRDGPKIVSLFVFPFMSRDMIANNKNPHHFRKYSRLLDAIAKSSDEDEEDEAADSSYTSSLELSRELMEDFRQKGVSENTVICQVLVPCRETFWVKDTTTGQIVQGDAKEKTVLHLVRFEQVTKTHIVYDGDNNSMSSISAYNTSRFFPFAHELGEWKITDIDDLCDGNLLL